MTIAELMTASPLTIRPDETLADALEIMRRGQCRHLPVVQAGKLVGILSLRDLELIAALGDHAANRYATRYDRLLVSDAMVAEPYSVDGDTAAPDVLAAMESRRLGSVVVTDDGHVIGVFTTVDALRELRRRLH